MPVRHNSENLRLILFAPFFAGVLFAVSSILVPAPALAHPVSFKDGIGIMPNFSPERQDIEVNYSYTAQAAAGFSAIRLDDDGARANFFIPHFNYRLYRNNQTESQTNVYILAGLGLKREDGQTDGAGLLSAQFDYETRRIYTLLLAEQLQGFDANSFTRVRTRAGVAPYLADFHDFHTWIIAQVEYTPAMQHEYTITPMLRFFYQNYLVEVGVSTRGDFSLSGIFHF